MESGTIVKWLKSEGDKVEKGEPLYELDTDKVTQEVEAEASGVLLKIAISAGEVEVGRTIAVIGEQGEQVELAPSEPVGTARPLWRCPAIQRRKDPPRARVNKGRRFGEPELPPTTGPTGVSRRPRFAPHCARARIDLSAVAGTGPDGRVVAEDVERTAASGAPVALSPPRCERRRRGAAAVFDAQDHRAPADRGLGGAGLPTGDHGRHGSRAPTS